MNGPIGGAPISDVLWNNPAAAAASTPSVGAFDSRVRTQGMGFLMSLLLILLGM